MGWGGGRLTFRDTAFISGEEKEGLCLFVRGRIQNGSRPEVEERGLTMLSCVPRSVFTQ